MKEFNLNLKVYGKNNFDIIMPFIKKNNVLVKKFKYYDKITQKEETIEICNYYNPLKNCSFTLVHQLLQIVYRVSLYADKKMLNKKMTVGR